MFLFLFLQVLPLSFARPALPGQSLAQHGPATLLFERQYVESDCNVGVACGTGSSACCPNYLSCCGDSCCDTMNGYQCFGTSSGPMCCSPDDFAMGACGTSSGTTTTDVSFTIGRLLLRSAYASSSPVRNIPAPSFAPIWPTVAQQEPLATSILWATLNVRRALKTLPHVGGSVEFGLFSEPL